MKFILRLGGPCCEYPLFKIKLSLGSESFVDLSVNESYKNHAVIITPKEGYSANKMSVTVNGKTITSENGVFSFIMPSGNVNVTVTDTRNDLEKVQDLLTFAGYTTNQSLFTDGTYIWMEGTNEDSEIKAIIFADNTNCINVVTAGASGEEVVSQLSSVTKTKDLGQYLTSLRTLDSYEYYMPDYVTSFIGESITIVDIYVPKLLDILYSDANGNLSFTSDVLAASEGKTPIGLCIASQGFFGADEKARWMSLKYMNYTTPETGSLTKLYMYWGNYGTDLNMIPNIQTTHNGGSDYGYLTADWITDTDNKIPSLFDANNEWNISVLGTVNQYAVTDIDGKNKTDKILATATTQATWQTDTTITNNSGAGYAPAACCCARYHTLGTQAGDWYLGASGEMSMIIVQKTAINAKLAQISAIYATDCISSLANSDYWSSTEYNSGDAYGVGAYGGFISNGLKDNSRYVVAMLQY